MNNQEIQQPFRQCTPVDVVVIILLLVGTALTLPTFRNLTPQTVTIFKDNRKIATYPLDTDRKVTIEGVLGPVTIQIKNGAVAVKEANCPHGICKKTGYVQHPHAQIVCAPNHLLITISSSTPDTLDAIVH